MSSEQAKYKILPILWLQLCKIMYIYIYIYVQRPEKNIEGKHLRC